MKVIAQRFKVVKQRLLTNEEALLDVEDSTIRCFAKGRRSNRHSTVRREYQFLSSLSRIGSFQHVVWPLWCGIDDDWDYLVTSWLPLSVEDVYANLKPRKNHFKALPWLASALASSLFAALKFIHSQGVVHCDIRPQNLMIRWDWEQQEAVMVLIDFEAACWVGGRRPDFVLHIGDPYYASPSFVRSPADPTPFDDLIAALNVLAICAGKFKPLPWAELCSIYRLNPTNHLRSSLADMKEAEIQAYYALLPPIFNECLTSASGADGQLFDYERYIESFAMAVPGDQAFWGLLLD